MKPYRSVYNYLDMRFVIIRKLAKTNPMEFVQEMRFIFEKRMQLLKYYEASYDFTFPYI